MDTLELKLLSQELVVVHGAGSKIKSATKNSEIWWDISRGVIEVKILISRIWKALLRLVQCIKILKAHLKQRTQ